jgi:hypothetical protein
MLLLWLTTTSAQPPVTPLWVTRGDAAAAAVSAAAGTLATTAAEVAAQGRAGRFPELHAQAAELVDRAVALRRAVSETP